MNKAELIEAVAKKVDASKATCKRCLEATLETISKELKKGGSVILTGFGSFTRLKRKARKGVNPATGKSMDIPAKNVPKFKPGKALRDMVA